MRSYVKQTMYKLAQYTMEHLVYPWCEETFCQKPPDQLRRDEIAAQIEQALTRTVWNFGKKC